jgi:WD40 repeat protein/serine/threonine protein kinase
MRITMLPWRRWSIRLLLLRTGKHQRACVSETTNPSQSIDDDPVLLQWVEVVKSRLEAGEPIELEDYFRQDPARAERLHRLLPAMGMMADLARAPDPGPSPSFGPGSEPVPGTLGDFRIVRELGRGGMGVVYEAEQLSLGRRVALKVLPLAAALDSKQLQRFQLEAHAAACLHHTNIVPVHAVGSERGVPFYAMQYIEGRSLAQLIAELRRLEGLDAIDRPAADVADLPTTTLAADLASGRLAGGTDHPADRDKTGSPEGLRDELEPAMPASGPAPGTQAPRPGGEPHSGSSTRSRAYIRTVAQLGVQAAEALDHAHTRGILHRDIKPGNLLVDGQGQLWVADFGLAQIQGNPHLTMTGDILGTLRYMSPEQALGKRVVIDGRTDIYALGVTLYELLTLRPALDGRDRQEILRKIAQEEPAPPGKLNPAIPRDLETIVLKAITKEPAERYATARELADDLRRFLEDKPIRARRVGPGQRAVLWARRRPAEAALVAVGSLALVALIVTGMSLWYGGQLRRERDLAQKFQYFQHIALANTAWRDGSLGRLEMLLDDCPAADRGHWEWRYLKRQCHAELLKLQGHKGGIFAMAYRPDGQRLASAGLDGALKIWDARTGDPLVAVPAHDGELVWGVAYSPDGTRVASVGWDGTVKIWDERTGELLWSRDHGGSGRFGWWVAFSPPDGARLATAGSDGVARVWDLATGERADWRGDATVPSTKLAFSRDGKRLATTRPDGTVAVWDATTGRVIDTLKEHPGPEAFSQAYVRGFAFSPDRDLIAAGTADGFVRIWDAKTSRLLRELKTHADMVSAVAFSPDGRWLASSAGNLGVKLWDVASGEEVLTIRGHAGQVYDLSFSPDGTRLATASHDTTIKIWDVTADPAARVLLGHRGAVNGVAFPPDGRVLASAGADGTVRVWDLATGRMIRTIADGRAAPVNNVVFGPDGKLLAWADASGTVRLWDLAADRVRLTIPDDHGGVFARVAFRPDGEHLATASMDGRVRVWDMKTGRSVRAYEGRHRRSVQSLAYSPDGRYLASGGEDTTVIVRDATADRVVFAGEGHRCWVHGVAYSRDGRYLSTATGSSPGDPAMARLASGSGDGSLKIWNARTGELLHAIQAHGNDVWGVDFSPDGTRLASASMDGTVKLWDVASGDEVLTLRGHAHAVLGVAFSPDGDLLASAGADGAVRIWDARPWSSPPPK